MLDFSEVDDLISSQWVQPQTAEPKKNPPQTHITDTRAPLQTGHWSCVQNQRLLIASYVGQNCIRHWWRFFPLSVPRVRLTDFRFRFCNALTLMKPACAQISSRSSFNSYPQFHLSSRRENNPRAEEKNPRADVSQKQRQREEMRLKLESRKSKHKQVIIECEHRYWRALEIHKVCS